MLFNRVFDYLGWLILVISFVLVGIVAKAASLENAKAASQESAKPAAPAAPAVTVVSATPALRSVSDTDVKAVATLNSRYQNAKSVSMNVEKTLRLGLVGQERKARGKLWLAKGKLRMELEGSEKSLLVVNSKNFWAVTYPSSEFKDAAVQVIKGDTTSKKAQSQAMIGLLGKGGFLKNFTPTGVQDATGGEKVYFLQPGKEQTDLKRAQLKISKDGKQILTVRYWDERDNETELTFSSVVFDKKLDEKMFNFVPPKNADIMNL